MSEQLAIKPQPMGTWATNNRTHSTMRNRRPGTIAACMLVTVSVRRHLWATGVGDIEHAADQCCMSFYKARYPIDLIVTPRAAPIRDMRAEGLLFLHQLRRGDPRLPLCGSLGRPAKSKTTFGSSRQSNIPVAPSAFFSDFFWGGPPPFFPLALGV